MKIQAGNRQEAQEARQELEKLAKQCSAACYQCGKCLAGCPMAASMDISPTQVMRLVQLGQIDKVLNSNTIWHCSACETCTTRCPQEVDIARVMDSLRNLAFEKGISPKDKRIKLAHELFLQNLKMFGRIFEPWLVFWYNFRSAQFFKDMEKGPAMFLKGKLPLFPNMPKGAKEVRRIFANVEKLKASRKTSSKEQQHNSDCVHAHRESQPCSEKTSCCEKGEGSKCQ